MWEQWSTESFVKGKLVFKVLRKLPKCVLKRIFLSIFCLIEANLIVELEKQLKYDRF